MQIRDILNELYKLERKGMDLSLDRVKAALKEVGNPEKKIKAIHVAGTNGKGSVTVMIASLLQEAGFKVGVYTSPHLLRFNERITVNGEEITPYEIGNLYKIIRPLISTHKLTFFEATTIMAFLHFSKKEVDYMVLEVGLGGRLDATNVIKPLVSVITNVDLEHQEYLGNTVKEIAAEKAGIIKTGVPVVTLATGDALSVIKAAAAKKKAKLTIPRKKYETNLAGEFQKWNAALAVSAFKALKIRSGEEMIRRSLGKIRWPGRLERRGNFILDCAHNPQATRELAHYLADLKYERLFLVFGVMSDKNVKEMLRNIEPLSSMTILTRARYYRSLEPTEAGKGLKSYLIQKPVSNALKFAKNMANDEDLILVTGSCYVIGEALKVVDESGNVNVQEKQPRHGKRRPQKKQPGFRRRRQ